MRIKEGLKDFLVGIIVITVGAILAISLILLWPFIAVIGWLVIMLLLLAITILMAFLLIMLVGRVIRGSYKNELIP